MRCKGYILTTMCAAVLFLVIPVQADDQGHDVVSQRHQELHAVVTKIDSGMIFMKAVEGQQNRVLSRTQAERMGLHDVKVGDELSLVIDEGNTVIDVHKAGMPAHGHQTIQGKVEFTDRTSKEIRLSTSDGIRSFTLDPSAVTKIAGMQKGDAVKLELDESNVVIDVHRDK